MYRLCLCLLLLIGLVEDKKLTVGGGSRGSSAARGNIGGQSPRGNYNPSAGGYHPQQSGGYHPQQSGGFNQPAPNYRPNPQSGGFQQPGGFHPNQPKSNFMPAPKSSHTFKKALLGGALGAAGGIAAYQLGKAILHSSSTPMNVNGQPYYFGDQNYQQKNGYFMCSMPLDEVAKQLQASAPATSAPAAAVTDASGNTESAPVSTTMSPAQFFQSVQFKDGTRPRSLTWSCKTGAEVCCGTECCPATQTNSIGHSGASSSSSSRGVSWITIILGVSVLLPASYC